MKIKKVILIIIAFSLIGGLAFGRMKEPEGDFDLNSQKKVEISDIKELLPQPGWIFPQPGSQITGKTKFQFLIPEITDVEIYLRQSSSLTEIYLGRAEKKDEKMWEFDLDSSSLPNGSYFLFLKNFSPFGQYLSKEIPIEIKNEVQREKEREEEIEKEIAPHLESLSAKEKELKEKEEKAKEEIEKVLEKTKQEVEEKVKPEKREEIKTHLEEKIPTLKQEINLKVERLKRAIEKEVKIEMEKKPEFQKEEVKKEREQIKKEITQKATEVLEKTPEIIPLKEALKEGIEKKLEKTETELREKIKERAQISPLVFQDSDSDNLSDWEELRLGTDPFNPDSDGDGFLDGIEYELGYDPLKPGTADKIVYSDAKKAKPQKTDLYYVERVTKITLPNGQMGIKIEGKGLPNSFVSVYIYSTPIVMVTKTDGNGNWSVVLDKPLTDGTHEVYTTVTNNHGEIISRSEPYIFEKSGERIVAITISGLLTKKTISPVQTYQLSFLILAIALIILAIGIALVIIGVSIQRKLKKEKEIS